MNEIVQNASSGISSFADVAGVGWIITVMIFIIIVITLTIIFRNIRRVIYGSIISGILIGIYSLSRYIGKSTQEGNNTPLNYFSYIMGFIIISYTIGTILDKIGIMNKIDNYMSSPIIEDKNE